MDAMSDVLRYRPPQAREETTASMGMILFLGSWAMLFVTLFFAYAYVRSRLTQWPPPGALPLPLALPALNTAVLAASSTAFQLGVREVRRARAERLGPWLTAAGLLGIAFLALQVALWKGVLAQGMGPDTAGPYSSVFYGLTGLHAVHVLVGLFGVGWVAARAFGRRYSAARHLPVKLWGLYWHFVGVVWALMFVTIFLL